MTSAEDQSLKLTAMTQHAGASGLGVWVPTGNMLIPRFEHSATLLSDGRVLIAGGFGSAGTLASCEVYYPVTGTWSFTGVMSTVRRFHGATLLPDGRVLVAGGQDATGALARAELYRADQSPVANAEPDQTVHAGSR